MKRSLLASLAGAMVLALSPAGVAAADVIDTDGLSECYVPEGFVEFNDALGFFESDIECMAAYGITVGDADGNFNSAGSVTRQQMALFIARLVALSFDGFSSQIPEATGVLPFDDIADVNPVEARDAIDYLAELDVVEGDGEGMYDPSGIVTRQQMASFVARAHVALGVDFTGFEATPGVFGDEGDIAAVHLDNVLLLANLGVVEGDADGGYNPANPVTRGQMSAFIVRSMVVLDAQGLLGRRDSSPEPPSPEPPSPEPHVVGITATNGGAAGTLDTGDVLVFTLSEPARFDDNMRGGFEIWDGDGTFSSWSCGIGQAADCSLSSDGLEFMVEIAQDAPTNLSARGSVPGIQSPGVASPILRSAVDDLWYRDQEEVNGF